MAASKNNPPSMAATTRERVLLAAERLLGAGQPDFSMRDLAAEAGVSFATPFNQFGNKAAITRALSAERIATMRARFASSIPDDDAVGRVLAAVGIATAVMLETPAVNRAVMAGLGAPEITPGQVLAQSRLLWAQALGEGEGLTPDATPFVRTVLPDQLAFIFRGVLSFWTAGEIADAELQARTLAAAATLLLGFVEESGRSRLMLLLPSAPAA